MAHELPLALPKYVILKNKQNSKYMRYTHEDTKQHGLLQFTGEEAVSPYAKFELEPSKTTEGLVHIRCCYNNKYWARTSETQEWIAAAADAPEEDQSLWSCTLFKPVLLVNEDDDTGTTNNLLLRFLHLQLNKYATCCPSDDDPSFHNFLRAGSQTTDPADTMGDVFEVLNSQTLLVLPQHVAFKGDNGLYLRTVRIGNEDYLQFSGTTLRDPLAGFQVFTRPDGGVRIKSNHVNRFLNRSKAYWILADAAEDNNNANTMFWPMRQDTDVVVLRNYGNALFCGRATVTSEGVTNCLSASVSSVTTVARIKVEEPVLSRNITDVDFRLQDARIYDQSTFGLTETRMENNSPHAITVPLNFQYTNASTRTWASNVTLKLAEVQTTIKSGVPLIGNGPVVVISGEEMSGAYTWGEPSEEHSQVERVYQITVGPHSRATTTLWVTRAACDVPFSYTQMDTLLDGTPVRYRMDDGVYTGTNFFNDRIETMEEKLSLSQEQTVA